MRCTDKLTAVLFAIIVSITFTGCGGASYDYPYTLSEQTDLTVSSALTSPVAETFASNLCVVNTDLVEGGVTVPENSCAGVFDLNACETLFAYRVHEKVNPASLTKVMTALVALKNGVPDQELVASENVVISEEGAQMIGLKEGDRMTLDQALHLLLIYSANDVAIMIAENIGGDYESFIDMMNKEATLIGATNSHFTNPHGLTEDDHYVTAYDMYLIFQAAFRYESFERIINMSSYTTQYYSALGNVNDVEIRSTNLYLQETKSAPANMTVVGGKTGTTKAAGHCLVLLARDTSANPYIAVILGTESTDVLYENMSALLGLCVK